MQTRLTTLLGIRHLIIQVPVGSTTTPQLVAAVSYAKGLGMLALSWSDSVEMRTQIRATRQLINKPIGVNLVLEWD